MYYNVVHKLQKQLYTQFIWSPINHNVIRKNCKKNIVIYRNKKLHLVKSSCFLSWTFFFILRQITGVYMCAHKRGYTIYPQPHRFVSYIRSFECYSIRQNMISNKRTVLTVKNNFEIRADKTNDSNLII